MRKVETRDTPVSAARTSARRDRSDGADALGQALERRRLDLGDQVEERLGLFGALHREGHLDLRVVSCRI